MPHLTSLLLAKDVLTSDGIFDEERDHPLISDSFVGSMKVIFSDDSA